MEDKKRTEEEGQPQDLKHQRPEETDVLVKAERPADDFLKSRRLDPDTLGKAKAE